MTVNELIEQLQYLSDELGESEICIGIITGTGRKVSRALIDDVTYTLTESEEDEDVEDEDYEGHERVWITVRDDMDNFYKVPSDIR